MCKLIKMKDIKIIHHNLLVDIYWLKAQRFRDNTIFSFYFKNHKSQNKLLKIFMHMEQNKIRRGKVNHNVMFFTLYFKVDKSFYYVFVFKMFPNKLVYTAKVIHSNYYIDVIIFFQL